MEDIFRAVQEGNEGEVIRLLDKDPALLEGRDKRKTPLVVAAEHGQLGVARLLVQRGANIHATVQHWGRTALHYAAYGGHVEVVAFLLGKGAQASTRDNYNVTPFMVACIKGHLGVVRMLLHHTGGEGLDARDDENGWTALHGAAFLGCEEVVRFLLLSGADPMITDSKGRTPHALATPEQPEHVDMHEELRARCARCVAVFKVRAHRWRTTWRPPLSGLDSMTSQYSPS
jgi:ankyrin repeat protein